MKKILFYTLWVMLIGCLSDLIRLASGLVAFQKMESFAVINDAVFWNLLSQIRLESISLMLCVGFLLIYYQLKEGKKQ